MRSPLRPVRTLALLAPVLAALLLVEPARAQTVPSNGAYAALPSEIPAQFVPVTESFDYVRRDVMIPMRDGVRLHTVILVQPYPVAHGDHHVAPNIVEALGHGHKLGRDLAGQGRVRAVRRDGLRPRRLDQ